MDVKCGACGEPWDNDTIHEEVAERIAAGLDTPAHVPTLATGGPTYSKVAAEFRAYGCTAFAVFTGKVTLDGFGRIKLVRCQAAAVESPGMLAATNALYDLLGDDMDGAASMLEDLGMGW